MSKQIKVSHHIMTVIVHYLHAKVRVNYGPSFSLICDHAVPTTEQTISIVHSVYILL